MLNILHIHNNDLAHSGQFGDYLSNEKKNNLNDDSIVIQNTDQLNEIKLKKYDIIIVHNSVRILYYLLSNNKFAKIIFIPHSNLVNNQTRNYWKNIQKIKPINLNLIIGSERAAKGFPSFGNENFKAWKAPTYGLDIENYSNKTSEKKKYDIGYFGRVDPDKSVHKVIEIASKLVEKLKRSVKLLIVGPESHFAGPYWDSVCVPKLDRRIILERYHWIEKKEFLKLMRCCRIILQPSTSIWETWCQVLWESLMSGTQVLGSDWDGIGEAFKMLDLKPTKVQKKGMGYRGDGTDLKGNYEGSLEFFNGYEIDTDAAVFCILNNIDSQLLNANINTEKIHSYSNRDLFQKVIHKIHSGAPSLTEVPADFSDDLDYLTG